MATPNDRKQVLKLYDGLRVTDVCDGMDTVGLQDVGLMDRKIGPLWRDTEDFSHRIYGIAHTVRFVPTGRRAPQFATREEFEKWKGEWYEKIARGPITEEIVPGDIVVIDATGVKDCGFIGSNNGLSWLAAGARGAVTNGGARDTDELIKAKMPVYSRGIMRGIRPGRLELESTGRPVECGGVFVHPGDLVVADGDGVIVVPWEKAPAVADAAIRIQEGDKAGRRKHYDTLRIPQDFTTRPRN